MKKQCLLLVATLISSFLLAASVGAQEAQMIEVGGHKLRMLRSGQGAPTVVFEGGIGGMQVWGTVVDQVAQFTTTVSYAHAGLDGSEAATTPRTPDRIVQELHTLLQRAQLPPPYVLVGHSMGGLEARLFAITYPSEVAGLVLVDGVHERQVLEFTRLDPIGFPRRREAGLNALSPPQRAEMDGLSRILSTGQLGVRGQLPDVPMVVLTSLQSPAAQGPRAPEVWRQLHAELFKSTTYGMHIVTSRSGHQIQRDEPQLVVSAVRWVVEAARRRP